MQYTITKQNRHAKQREEVGEERERERERQRSGAQSGQVVWI